MSDDDKSYSTHLFWALGLLDSDEEREYNEIEDAKANDGNERINEGHSSLMEDSDDDYQWPYLSYALGLGDLPQESETSNDTESDDVLISDDESEVSYEENESDASDDESELSDEENESEENDDDNDDEGNEENYTNSEGNQDDDDENELNDDNSYVFPHISKKLKKN